jgi:hypothetical protein
MNGKIVGNLEKQAIRFLLPTASTENCLLLLTIHPSSLIRKPAPPALLFPCEAG